MDEVSTLTMFEEMKMIALELVESQRECDKLRRKSDEKSEEVDKLKRRINELEWEVKDKSAQFEVAVEAAREAEAQRSEQKDAFLFHKIQLEGANRSRQQYQEEMITLQKENNELNRTIKAADEKIKSLQQYQQIIQNKESQWKLSLGQLTREMKNLEFDHENLKGTTELVRDELEKGISKIPLVLNRVEEQNKRIEDLFKENASLVANVIVKSEEGKRNCDSTKDTVEAITKMEASRIKDLTDEIAALNQGSAVAMTTIEHLIDEKEHLKEKIKLLELKLEERKNSTHSVREMSTQTQAIEEDRNSSVQP